MMIPEWGVGKGVVVDVEGVDDVGEGVDVIADKLNPLGGLSGLGGERVGMKSLAV